MSPEEAWRDALMKLGGVEQTKERYRDQRVLRGLESVLQDLPFAFRMLRKNAAFTSVAVLALALGIGFSTIIFSIFYNGVLYPFPYRDAERLTVIGIVDTEHNAQRFREMYHLEERSPTLSSGTAHRKSLWIANRSPGTSARLKGSPLR